MTEAAIESNENILGELIDQYESTQTFRTVAGEVSEELKAKAEELQSLVERGGTTGNIIDDLIIGQFGKRLLEENYAQMSERVRTTLHYLEGKADQPILSGEYSKTKSTPQFVFTLSFMESNKPKIGLVRSYGSDRVELILSTLGRHWLLPRPRIVAGKSVDDILSPRQEIFSLSAGELNRDYVGVPQQLSSEYRVLAAGYEDVAAVIEEAGAGLQYFRASHMAGYSVEIPESAHGSYDKACVDFVNRAMHRDADKNLLELEAKSLGFSSITAAIQFGGYLRSRDLEPTTK